MKPAMATKGESRNSSNNNNNALQFVGEVDFALSSGSSSTKIMGVSFKPKKFFKKLRFWKSSNPVWKSFKKLFKAAKKTWDALPKPVKLAVAGTLVVPIAYKAIKAAVLQYSRMAYEGSTLWFKPTNDEKGPAFRGQVLEWARATDIHGRRVAVILREDGSVFKISLEDVKVRLGDGVSYEGSSAVTAKWKRKRALSTAKAKVGYGSEAKKAEKKALKERKQQVRERLRERYAVQLISRNLELSPAPEETFVSDSDDSDVVDESEPTLHDAPDSGDAPVRDDAERGTLPAAAVRKAQQRMNSYLAEHGVPEDLIEQLDQHLQKAAEAAEPLHPLYDAAVEFLTDLEESGEFEIETETDYSINKLKDAPFGLKNTHSAVPEGATIGDFRHAVLQVLRHAQIAEANRSVAA